MGESARWAVVCMAIGAVAALLAQVAPLEAFQLPPSRRSPCDSGPIQQRGLGPGQTTQARHRAGASPGPAALFPGALFHLCRWPAVLAAASLAGLCGRRHRESSRRGVCRFAQSGARGAVSVPCLLELKGQQSIRLPELTEQERENLIAGSQVRRQERHGNRGWGFVVGDVDAAPHLVMEVLSDFENYAGVIPVVRKADVVSRGVSTEGIRTARCNYKISKFWLNVSALQSVIPEKSLVHFELDPSATGCVLQEAAGFWHVEPAPGGSSGSRSRVWLCVGLRACRWLPAWLLDYASERALRRATGWLRPHMERARRAGRAMPFLRRAHSSEPDSPLPLESPMHVFRPA